MAVVSVRLVRSFEHRNFQVLVFHHVNLEQTVQEFIQHVKRDIASRAGVPPPFKRFGYDTMKINHQPHGAKTGDLVMSLEDDDKLILSDGLTLTDAGVANETELAFFRREDYSLYKTKPQDCW